MNEVTTQKPQLVVLRERLEDRRTELRNALVDVTPDQFIRAVTTAAQINPDLQAVTWQSLWNACLRACRDDLLPDGVDGAIVPYKDKATWIPMYQGLLRRFRRSGQFKAILADCVRDADSFTYYVDETGPHLRHEPSGDFAAPIVKVYALATTKDGGIFVAVLPRAEVEKIRGMSRAKRDDSPWQTWFEEMAKKTALRRLSKYLPSGRDLLGSDADEADDLEHQALHSPTRTARAPGAAAALQEFAASSPEPGDPVTPAGDGDAGGERDTPGESSELHETERDPAAAYKRGQAAKAGGMIQRRAVPGEYRDNTRLALAWLAGYDGSPMPTFGTAEG